MFRLLKHGLVALPDRAAFADRVAPVTGPARDRMVEATIIAAKFLLELVEAVAPPDAGDALGGASSEVSWDTLLCPALLAAGRTHLAQASRRCRDGMPVDDEQAALVTVLLNLPEVREYAARSTTSAQWELDMWADLVRRAEPDFVAGSAILLTLSALKAGDGPLAAIAVERALQADPADRLAHLLAKAVSAGIDPAALTALLAD